MGHIGEVFFWMGQRVQMADYLRNQQKKGKVEKVFHFWKKIAYFM